MERLTFVRGVVIRRPSKQCKSPYVADVLLDDGSEIIAHAPSLGFLCEKGSVIYMTLSARPTLCTHIIHLGKQNDIIVGIHPKSAEKIVEFALKNNLIDSLKNLKELQREKKMLNSRFDFMGIDEQGHPFILEVKSVPLCENNIAYFPGSHKKNACISPRALKHIQELQHIKENYPNYRTLLCFVVQRQDATSFRFFADAYFECRAE